MKTLANILAFLLLLPVGLFAQGLLPNLQNYRPVGQAGTATFEDPKNDTLPYDGMKVRVGGSFALQFQGLNQENAFPATGNALSLVELGSDFNLPTANLNIDAQLAKGVRMSLVTYLSARHHQEAWVKGGHILINSLDFVKEGFLSGVMEVVTIKVGLDEINYGDMHFRRTDNARAIYNPFVGNLIADAFSTEAFGEVYVQKQGFIGMLGISNGKLNQNVVVNSNTDNKVSLYGKLGYDKQLTDDFRLRLTGSFYSNQGTTTGTYLYAGDRAGGRYYGVMDVVGATPNDFSGRMRVRFKQLTAIQFNPFVKFKGLEFFGVYESMSGGDADGNGSYSQVAAEALYRFGKQEKVYIGGRYNQLSGKATETAENQKVSRVNVGGGWFLTPNILAKAEYVMQQYTDAGWAGTAFEGGKFKGFVLEATIGF